MSSLIEDFKSTFLQDELIGSNYERIGIGGFTFYASVNESVSKTASITSNPIEDGSTVNDHIIKNPVVVIIEGEVSKLFIELKPNFNTIQDIYPPVGIIGEYIPLRTATQLSKINGLLATASDFYEKANTAIEKGTQIYDFFTSKQADTTFTSKFLEFFSTVYESRSIIDVECVDTIYKDMAISSFTVIKPQNEKDSYSFNITLQKIVKVQTQLISIFANNKVDISKASGNAKAQAQAIKDKGTQQTKEVDESIATAIVNAIKGF